MVATQRYRPGLTQTISCYSQGAKTGMSECTSLQTLNQTQHDTRLRAAHGRKEQETEGAICTGSPKSDTRRLEKTLPVLINNMKSQIHPALYQWFRLVVVV